MFLVALLLTNLSSCPPTKFENKSKYAWNSFDKKMYNYAQKRCGELYEDATCVKLFRKFEKKGYSVLCGEAV